MSDKYTTLFGVDASFVQGEQPTHTKLTNIVALTRNGLSELEKVIGMTRNSLLVESTGNTSWVPVPAKISYSPSYVESLKLDFPSSITSIARAIGPMGALNPRYLSGQTWNKDDLGGVALGVLLKSGVTEQQLPFKPLNVNTILPADFSGPQVSLIFATRVSNYEESLEVGKYYVSSEGRLFTGAPVRPGTRLRYSFVIGEGDGYIGSGYNVIPDPSILTLSLEERDNKTLDTSNYGACRVLISSINEEALVVDILLPEVISTPFSKLSASHEVEDSDPVGKIDEGLPDLRRYSLPDLYPSSGYIEDNTMYLYYTEIGKVIPEARFERISEFVIRAYLPARYKTIVRADDGELFNVEGLSNTKHFFLITNGTQLAPLVGKLRLEMEEHSHNGLDSVRVSHSDLTNVNHITPSLPAQLSIYSNITGAAPNKSITLDGLPSNSTFWFNRKLSKGDFLEENPHPYYLHRLGYLGGGTDGIYAAMNAPGLGASLGNGFTGDLVLMPVSKNLDYEDTDQAYYSWESTEGIDYLKNNSASHSLWFGLPWEVNALGSTEAINQRQRNGSVRMYFDPWIKVMGFTSSSAPANEPFATEGLGILNTGTIGDDVFSNSVFENAIKGLNIQRGNFFFGYNEDKFLSTTERAKGKSSFNILASEFNAVVTANKKATQSGEVRWKGQSGNRSGFAVKAIEGSSINFSVGGLTGTAGNDNVNTASLSNYFTPGIELAGSFTVEAAFGNQLISLVKGHGSGILMSPGTGTTRLFPWQLKSLLIPMDDYLLPTKYAGWKHLEEINNNFIFNNSQNLGGVGHIFAILDSAAIESYLTFAKNVDLTESVKNKNSFPFGKLILEGSSGIDLLVSRGTYSSSVAGILNVLDLSEVRFWAREDLKGDIDNQIRDNHAVGANLNLMYGYGKAYSKFAVSLPWTGSEEDIKGLKVQNLESNSGGINPWTSLRTEGLNSWTNKDTRGSQIRQASFIEAMEGFRNDPNQPFTVSYKLPFRVIQRLDWISNGYTTEHGVAVAAWSDLGGVTTATGGGALTLKQVFIPSAIIGSFPIAKQRVITDDIENYDPNLGYTVNPAINVSCYKNQPAIQNGRFVFSRSDTPIDDLGYGVFVDQIIRYYDFQDWAASGYEGNFIPGQSLIDFKVDLNYSKLVYGDSTSGNYGKSIPYSQNVDLDDFTSEDEESLNSYISGKHYSVIRGVDLTNPSRDGGVVIRSIGSSSGLASSAALDGSSSWAASATQEPFKASLMLGNIKLNGDDDYKGSDSIGHDQWLLYLDKIKSSIDPDVALIKPQYNGEKDEGGTLNVPQLAWFLQLEGEPKMEDYSLHRFAPYELFMSSNGKEHGLGPGAQLMLAFDGYVTLTFRTLGGTPPASSGVVTQPS
jgi:hypothetical protein